MGLLTGFVTLGLVIALGSLLAQLRLVGEQTQRELLTISFVVASPALMVTTIGDADLGDGLVGSFVAAAASVAVAAGSYAARARWRRRREAGDLVVGAMASSYVNAGNLGIPVAGYVLGDAAAVAPVLLLQMLVVQPLALVVLDAQRPGERPGLLAAATRPLRNPLTVGALLGVVLAVTGYRLPEPVRAPVELVGAFAIPAMLIAYGISLRLGPGLAGVGSRVELAVTSLAKLVVQPAVAYLVARWALGIEGPTLLAVVVCAGLPTAQNIFLHASRYERMQVLARDTILLTTVLSVPVLVVVTLLLG